MYQETLELECLSRAIPPPTIRWYFNDKGKALTTEQKTEISFITIMFFLILLFRFFIRGMVSPGKHLTNIESRSSILSISL